MSSFLCFIIQTKFGEEEGERMIKNDMEVHLGGEGGWRRTLFK